MGSLRLVIPHCSTVRTRDDAGLVIKLSCPKNPITSSQHVVLEHHKRVSAALNKAEEAALQILSYAVGMTICLVNQREAFYLRSLVMLVAERSLEIKDRSEK
mmetsp:Transcript_67453/g.100005  ORF Transcript_67453/g.100005 Transcript_67453/m.100005 type:complete len:102 (-) Transcript_67453:71-376(-)